MANSILFANNATSTIATSNVLAGDSSLIVGAGTGTLFPNPSDGDYFYCTLQNSAGTVREIVKVTARSTDTFSITRAQEGTTAQGFSIGDTVELRLTTQGILDAISQASVDEKLYYFKLGVV